VLEHVFPPFLACCADAVMLSKRNVAIGDDDDVTAMTKRFAYEVAWWASNVFVFNDFGMKCFVFFELRSRDALGFDCQWITATLMMMIGDNVAHVVG
jgi:hypothetical protein